MIERVKTAVRNVLARFTPEGGAGWPERYFGKYLIPRNTGYELIQRTHSDLAKMFFAHEGYAVEKWVHYLDAYARHFGPYRGTPVRMLEIGVNRGGSLAIWREYLGDAAVIYGVDINPDCARFAESPNQVRIGSQADPQFLRAVVEEMGGIDIVLDDGSHVARHQRITLDTLFPLLSTGGIYAVEDLHTAYWPRGFGGGYKRKGTAVEFVKSAIDDMHGWYHSRDGGTPAKEWISAIHVYDSVVFFREE